MEYIIETDETLKIVICSATGDINSQNAPPMAKDARAVAFQKHYPILYDFSQTRLVEDLSNIFKYARELEYKDPHHKALKAAIFYKRDKKLWKFFVTTASNSGIFFELFEKKTDALTWLKS